MIPSDASSSTDSGETNGNMSGAAATVMVVGDAYVRSVEITKKSSSDR